MQNSVWGIDLGGTKAEGVILTSSTDIKPLLRIRVDTHADKGYEEILKNIQSLVENMKTQSGLFPRSIGIGTPGILDPLTQMMKNCNSTALNGRSLKKDLGELLGVPVELANDANCFALAEARWGIIKNYPDSRLIFGIILGTGVGGGLVFDKNIWSGRHGIAGEWGHNFLDESGGSCYCGKRGCVETILSGPALQKYYSSLGGDAVSLKEIVSRYRTGNDPLAEKTMERLFYFFGKSVAAIINILDPDLIVIGGGVGNITELYDQFDNSLGKYIFNNRIDVPVVAPVLGDSAGVFGAAALTLSA